MKPDIPSKLYYSISEVARITDVKAHVLRYWESEFPTLQPKKARNGSRRYRRSDIDEILAIKELLYTDGFKIAGARKARRKAKQDARHEESEQPAQLALSFDQMSDSEKLKVVQEELREVLELVHSLGIEPEQLKQMKGKG